jgi:AraC family transcriptional regulator
MNRPVDVQQLRHHSFSRIEDAQLPLPKVLITLETVQKAGGFYETLANGPCTELTYVIPRSGGWRPAKCCFDIGDDLLQIGDLGPLILRPCGVPLRAFSEPEETGVSQILMCSFDDNFFADTTGLDSWSPQKLVRCNNLQSKAIALMMRRIALELTAPQFGAAIAIESLVQLILVEVARIFDPRRSLSVPVNRRLAPWQLRKIEEHLRDATNQWPTLSELAELCGVSAKHLSRVFSETTGMPIKKYSEQIRIERAKTLLGESHMAVKQVAATLGFPNPNYFSTAFHRATGATPTEFVRCS